MSIMGLLAMFLKPLKSNSGYIIKLTGMMLALHLVQVEAYLNLNQLDLYCISLDHYFANPGGGKSSRSAQISAGKPSFGIPPLERMLETFTAICALAPMKTQKSLAAANTITGTHAMVLEHAQAIQPVRWFSINTISVRNFYLHLADCQSGTWKNAAGDTALSGTWAGSAWRTYTPSGVFYCSVSATKYPALCVGGPIIDLYREFGSVQNAVYPQYGTTVICDDGWNIAITWANQHTNPINTFYHCEKG